MNSLLNTTSFKEEKEDSEELFASPTLGDFVRILCKTAQRKFDPEALFDSYILSHLKEPFFEVAKHNVTPLILIQRQIGVPFAIKQKSPRKGLHLLYEGRHLRQGRKGIPFSKKFGAWHIVFDCDGAVETVTKKIQTFPKTHHLPASADPSVRLAQLVSVTDDNSEDPKTYEETIAWLTKRELINRTRIDFSVRLLPTAHHVGWISPEKTYLGPEKFIYLHAYSGKNNQVLFRNPPVRTKLGRKPNILPEAPAAPEETKEEQTAALFQSNRACGAHVEMSGLTKALKLGMLSGGKDFLLTANRELSKSFATIWLHHDARGEVRHAGYRDGLDFYASFQIFPGFLITSSTDKEYSKTLEEKSWQSWKALFDCVWDRRAVLLAHKENIIGPIVEAWTASANNESTGRKKMCKDNQKRMGGSYAQCVTSLRVCLKKVKIVCFCGSDLLVHSLKVPLAHYSETVLGEKGGVKLRTVGSTKIVCLVTNQIEIENVGNILGLKCDEENGYKDDGEELVSVWKEWTAGERGAAPLLPAKPLLDCDKNILVQKELAFTPGRVNSGKLTAMSCVENRASTLTATTLSLYSVFCAWVCSSYSLDLTTSPYTSLSSLAFKCVWLSLVDNGGPLYQSLEKTKPAYARVLRNLCRGGFAYSCKGSLASGDPVTEGGEPAASLKEFDLTSAYGFSMRNMSVPGGFCIGYSAAATDTEQGGSGKVNLARTDKMNRAEGFEFSATVAVCARLERQGDKITAAWSNYSPLGLCYLGKYPLDLVVVLDSGVAHFINFDGQFAHGCSTCPGLKRYVNSKPLEQVLLETRERDKNINEWIENSNASGRLVCEYHVFSSCHDADFWLSNLRDAVAHPDLALLRQPYDHLPRKNITSLDFFFTLPDDLTYLLVGRGEVPEEKRGKVRGPPLLVWKRAGERDFQDFAWETEQDALFSRDSLAHLTENFGFRLTRVTHCFFYRRCTVLPRVFENLTLERQELAKNGLTAKAKFIKSLVNYSTGMFGYNPAKKNAVAYKNARLVSKLSYRVMHSLSTRNISFVAQAKDKSYAIVKTRAKPLAPSRSLSVALPIYASVVEYGKARLADCHNFITWSVRPGAFRCLYSNTDNIVCALSGNTVDDVVEEKRREAFERKKHLYFGSEPGLLSEKWSVSSPPAWKFVSPMICNYSVVIENSSQGSGLPLDGRCKSSGFKDLLPQEAHEMSMGQLAAGGESTEKISHMQKRRINRLLNMETHNVDISAAKIPNLNKML